VPDPIGGHFAVDDSARLLRNYRYATERMMRTLGGWLALTPELSAKLLMGRHVWDNAQHADAFGKRLPELRAHGQESEPANAAFVVFMELLESPEDPDQTVERLVGVYRVLKPHLIATYERHLGLANGVYEPPTRRILGRCIEDERRHVAAGETVIGHLMGEDGLAERAAAWQGRLEQALAAAAGVSGDELSAPAGKPVVVACHGESAEAREFIRLETAATRWPIPDELMEALRGLGDALVTGDFARAERWLGEDAVSDGEIRSALSKDCYATSRLVACARVGAKRVIKLRLEGAKTSLLLATRWASGSGGWRAEAIEVLGVSATRPA